ncbi:MAG TPA: hypothetical protein VFA03_17335 [Acetobacteraceae bacterium]|nr:hypothetical protein [Acetobacteraceae bacterium]
MSRWLRGPRRGATLALAVGAMMAASAGVARAAWVVGVGPIWAPFYYPPPVYYPPAYYPPAYPPPVDEWYTPPPAPVAPAPVPTPTAQSCNAGAYVCPMERPVAPGTTCWCPNNQGGRSYGRAS